MRKSTALLVVFNLLLAIAFFRDNNDIYFSSCITTMCAYFIVKLLEEKL